MNKLLSIALAAVLAPTVWSGTAQAQTGVLSEIYGRGVHAYYNHQYVEATSALTMAINAGFQDPRAYYFRGIVAQTQGQIEAAESDWRIGARLEAEGKVGGAIGRSLARYQGMGRLKLEEIRRLEKLNYLAEAATRSKARYGEIEAAQGDVLRRAPAADPAPAAAKPPAGMQPPPSPPAATDDPFSDAAAGEPKVQSDDALEGAMKDPFSDDPSGTEMTPETTPSADPFGGDAGGDDPFGGDTGGDDLFGGDDPFGS